MKAVVLAVVAVAIACTACASSSDVAGERRNVGNVTVTFTAVPARAKRGQSVRLTIRLLNNSGQPTTLTFGSSQRYDFWITSGSREVWRWSAGRMFTQDIGHQELAGQTGASFAESWPATEGGKLVAHARLTAESYDDDMTAQIAVE
jgi:hypothetical protein